MKFTSILKNVILEQSKYQILLGKFTEPSVDKEGKKSKPKIKKEDFYEIIKADPTTRLNNVDLSIATEEDMNNVKAGKYTPWLLKWYLNPQVESKPEDKNYVKEVEEYHERYMEDLSQLTTDLIKYERFKNRIEGERDIMKLTPAQLYGAVKDFSLMKTKASKEEKDEASQTFKHPGGKVLFRGNEYTLIMITDPGQLGKDAACFYGGYQLGTAEGESRWCTSSPGYDTWFNRYIKEGPLYVIIKNEDAKFGAKSKLPATRWQFHFPSDQFQDADNSKIDVIKFLNGPARELKEFFKPEFAKGALVKGDELKIDDFNSGAVGKFIALYGLDDLMDTIPDNLTSITIQDRNGDVDIKLPDSISRFKDLNTLVLRNCVSEIPETICQLKKLNFITLINNPKLKQLPACIATDLPKLIFVNLQGSDNVQVPDSFKERGTLWGNNVWDFETEEDEEED
jgi:hypothetical protein